MWLLLFLACADRGVEGNETVESDADADTDTDTNTDTDTDTDADADTDTDEDRVFVAYFVEWGVYDRAFRVWDIPGDDVTHVNYAFAQIVDGRCAVYDDWAATQLDGGNVAQFADLKTTHPDLGDSGHKAPYQNFGRVATAGAEEAGAPLTPFGS